MSLTLSDYNDYYPSTWEKSAAYETTLYVLKELQEHQDEYQTIKKAFTSVTPTKIHRIQHPTAYLRYLVHTEFLENENIDYTESIAYFPVDTPKMDVCISYNCDNRVLSGNENFQSTVPSYLGTEKSVIVVQKRSCSIDTDKNYYPIYAVQF
ncbi:uncharacterized protein LOC143915196 [Arctopsyche grandis]|uniref:uncharacterized protein LOC143915196 n=1 Tax=Arctopsyche grandis TaxID=121162 RepID=UPI00406D7479